MNKKGFTLIELLAVIVVLALVIVIAVPSINAITGTIKDNMLEKKLKIIEEAAILYGQDRRGAVVASKKTYEGSPCESILVSKLVPDYLDKDNDNECLTSTSTNTIGCIENPKDSMDYLDKYEIIIYYRNKRIKAIVDKDNNLVCNG